MAANRCAKRRYRTKVDAMLALATIDRRVSQSGRSDKAPVRTYRCGSCRGWHLTSRP